MIRQLLNFIMIVALSAILAPINGIADNMFNGGGIFNKGGSGSVTADAPLTGSGTLVSHLAITKADGSHDGYLSSADFNTFNSKGSGTVTGTGTSGQISYWTGTSVIGGLDTATYPSTTELSYVKGVTSSIQTQLNAKSSISGLTSTYIPVANSSTSIANSRALDDGTHFVFGTNNSASALDEFTNQVITSGDGSTDNLNFSGIGGIDSKTVLMLHVDNNITDSEITPKTVTNHSSAVTFSNSIFKFGYSAFFNNSNATYLTVPTSTDFNFPADFTVDLWVYPTVASGSTFYSILGTLDVTSGTTGWTIGYQSGRFNFLWNTSSFSSGSTYAINNWYHLAVVRNGSSVVLYVNGVSDATATNSASISNSNTLYIGQNPDLARPFAGYEDEIRISKGIARWTTGFTPPASAYTNSVGTVCKTFAVGGSTSAQMCAENSTNTAYIKNNGNTVMSATSAGIPSFPNASSSTNHAICWKAGGVLGYCSVVVDSSGVCGTCN